MAGSGSIMSGPARYNRGVRRYYAAYLLLALALVVSVSIGAAPETPTEKLPNVLFITIDTLRADHLSAWGYHLETSPNMDRIASEGVRYANAYTVTSRTAPSHYSMFSSRYPQEHGAKLNGFAVPADTKFLYLPQILQRYKYKNGAFVSAWPLTKRLTKLDPFFDTYDEDLSRSYQMINSMRYAEDVTPRAIRWIEEHKEGPFFAWVHMFDPHSPYDLRADFEPKPIPGRADHTKQRGQDIVPDNLKAYNSEIFYTDHWVGKLVDAVDAMGLKESTLVVILADHGESIGERNYQGHSSSLYENVVHIPMIFRMPGTIQAGKVVRTKVTTLDILPTLIDLTVKQADPGAKVPTEYVGRTLAGNLTGDATIPDRTVRYVAFSGQRWVMPGWLSKLWLRKLDFPESIGYRTGDRKVIWKPSKEDMQVFDLAKDPFENNPLKPEGGKGYDKEEETLSKWYESTDLGSGENRMTERDKEALKSLGYIQ